MRQWLKEKCHQRCCTATCVRAHKYLTNPYASCSDCCIMLCWSWLVVVVVVAVECCIPYRLVLMLVLTFAPCTLTFAPCACGAILPSTSASGHWLQLVLVAFLLQPLQQTLLAPVMVSPIATCGGLFPSTHSRTYSTCARATSTVWWWSVCGIYIYIYMCESRQ